MEDRIINTGEQKWIPLSRLRPSPLNTYETGDVDDLIGSILSCGRLITPLTVIGPDENGFYQIIAGERRFKALTELNKRYPDNYGDVPCYVVGPDDMDTLEQRLLIETSNLETRDFDKNEHRFEVIRILKEMADRGDIKHHKIVGEAGKYMKTSPRYNRMYKQIFEKGSEELQDLVKQGKVPISTASRIAGKDSEEQKQIVETIKSGTASTKAINDLAKKKEESTAPVPPEKPAAPAQSAPAKPSSLNNKWVESILEESDDLEIDDSLDDEFNSMATDASIERDSTGMIGKIKNSETQRENEQEDDRARDVIKWCQKMQRKTSYSDTELEAFDAIRELISVID